MSVDRDWEKTVEEILPCCCPAAFTLNGVKIVGSLLRT